MPDALITSMVAIIVAILSPWITVQLSLRRFRTERWWERKADAYSNVIEALHNSKEFSDQHLDALFEAREISEERGQELRERATEAAAEIRRVADVGAFWLSDEAMVRIARYRKEEAKASETQSWHEYLEGDWKAVSTCLKDMIHIAKTDLKVQSQSWIRKVSRIGRSEHGDGLCD